MKNYFLELVLFSCIFLLATKCIRCTLVETSATNCMGCTPLEASELIMRPEFKEIDHSRIEVNGINIHVASKGEGPTILFIHGYPQLWYTWRHQMLSLSSRGYRTLAPDLRGYGDSDKPTPIGNYSMAQVGGDIIQILDMLKIDKVFLVAHDWGALLAWHLSLVRTERIKAMVILSVPYFRRAQALPTELYRRVYGEDFYICRFQEPGVAEAEYARADLHTLFKKILTDRSPGPHRVSKSVGFGAVPETPITLPSWLTEDDIDYYAFKYNQSGFSGPLNHYRNVDSNWENSSGDKVIVDVPVKFITGDRDMTYTIPKVNLYVQNSMKKLVPNLQEIVIMEGVGHFIQEEKADEISDHIFNFVKQF